MLPRTVFQAVPLVWLRGECLEETSGLCEQDRLEHADLRSAGYTCFFEVPPGVDVSPNIIETRTSDFVSVDRSKQLENRVDFYNLRC